MFGQGPLLTLSVIFIGHYLCLRVGQLPFFSCKTALLFKALLLFADWLVLRAGDAGQLFVKSLNLWDHQLDKSRCLPKQNGCGVLSIGFVRVEHIVSEIVQLLKSQENLDSKGGGFGPKQAKFSKGRFKYRHRYVIDVCRPFAPSSIVLFYVLIIVHREVRANAYEFLRASSKSSEYFSCQYMLFVIFSNVIESKIKEVLDQSTAEKTCERTKSKNHVPRFSGCPPALLDKTQSLCGCCCREEHSDQRYCYKSKLLFHASYSAFEGGLAQAVSP